MLLITSCEVKKDPIFIKKHLSLLDTKVFLYIYAPTYDNGGDGHIALLKSMLHKKTPASRENQERCAHYLVIPKKARVANISHR